MFKLNSIAIKTVNYFGMTVTVPSNAKYLATDNDGALNWFVHKPERMENSIFNNWYLPSDSSPRTRGFVSETSFEGDWKDSFLTIPENGIAKEIIEALAKYGYEVTKEGDSGFYFRYDTDDNDSHKAWEEYVSVLEQLRVYGLTLKDSLVEHDCISGMLVLEAREIPLDIKSNDSGC
jgi:hypothetical protein